MKGDRETFACPSCGKRFTYWIPEANAHPKAKCYFCGKESFPKGEPPPAPTVEPAPAVVAPPAPATSA